MTKVAVVVQRYGEDIVGGSEALARAIVKHLKSDLGLEVDVITTTAKSYQTWENYYDAGTTVDSDGTRILRFNSTLGRSNLFHLYERIFSRIHKALSPLPLIRKSLPLLEDLWLILQGPFTPKLTEYIKHHKNEYHRFFFFTYLYYPTIFGLKSVAKKAILIPTAHDELPFHFTRTSNILNEAATVLVNTPAERDLVLSKAPNRSSSIHIAGLGFDISPHPKKVDKPDKPYLLYLGRISKSKGVHNLIDSFQSFKEQNPNRDVQLLLAGHLEQGISIPETEHLKYLGFIREEDKVDLLQKSIALINPSPLESLSMIVIDAMASQVPALVNGHCHVMKEYANQSKTVFAYHNQEEFDQLVLHILTTDWQSDSKQHELMETRSWITSMYSWDNVMSKYRESLL